MKIVRKTMEIEERNWARELLDAANEMEKLQKRVAELNTENYVLRRELAWAQRKLGLDSFATNQ